MNARPMNDRILLREIKDEKKGVIIMPGIHEDTMIKCEVVAVGRGRVTDSGEIVPVDTKIGSVVMIDRRSTIAVKIEDEDLMLIEEAAILLICKEA